MYYFKSQYYVIARNVLEQINQVNENTFQIKTGQAQRKNCCYSRFNKEWKTYCVCYGYSTACCCSVLFLTPIALWVFTVRMLMCSLHCGRSLFPLWWTSMWWRWILLSPYGGCESWVNCVSVPLFLVVRLSSTSSQNASLWSLFSPHWSCACDGDCSLSLSLCHCLYVPLLLTGVSPPPAVRKVIKDAGRSRGKPLYYAFNFVVPIRGLWGP